MISILSFGSSQRGDSDSYSDRDLAVVAPKIVHKLIKWFIGNRNYAISFFTIKQLESMSHKGALFLQHLKMESSFVFDPLGRCSKLIKEAEFKVPNVNEVLKSKLNLKLALELDCCDRMVAVKIDLCYGLIRDLCIKLLARENCLEFSAVGIIKQIQDRYVVDEPMIDAFLNARKIKNCYRSQRTIENICMLSVIEGLGRLALVLGVSVAEKPRALLDVARDVDRLCASAYILLRVFEMLSDQISIDDKALRRWVVSPNAYSFSSKVMRKKLLDAIESSDAG